MIDAHVHFNEPGRTTGRAGRPARGRSPRAAPRPASRCRSNAHPPTLDGAAFDAKVEAAGASSVVDFALWGGLTPATSTGSTSWPSAASSASRRSCATAASRTSRPPTTRCWTPACSARRRSACRSPSTPSGRPPLREPAGTTWRDFVASRPVEAELEAIEVAIELAERTGCSLHVVHVSSGAGVALVAASDATCETCPHYLTLTEDDLETLGTRAKCAPPLRPAAERDALWEHLTAGRIAFVASDHSPCPPEMKAGDFTAAWGGIAGAQATLGLLLERLPAQTVAALTCADVAGRFNLPKGRLEPGADADLVLVDLRDREAPRTAGPPQAEPVRRPPAPAHRPHPRCAAARPRAA